MTEEQVIYMKGNPTKIENTVAQSISGTENNTTYVYGNKVTGDILKFRNGILYQFTDR